MHLNIFLSQSCFVYCKGCYSYSRTEKIGTFLDSKKIIHFLKFAYTQGINKVTFCGGDPLTRKDVLKVLKNTKKIGFSITIDTVGTSLLRDIKCNNKTIVKKVNAKRLVKYCDIIGIPIDGSSSNIIKTFRPCTYDILQDQIRVCELINYYKENLCINTVVHNKNLEDVNNLVELMNKLKFGKKWQLFQYAPLGKYGMLYKNEFEISKDEFDNFKKIVLKKYNGPAQIEFKDNEYRNKKYMLIDNSGNVWIQHYDINQNNERVLIGNIQSKKDWHIICDKLKKENLK